MCVHVAVSLSVSVGVSVHVAVSVSVSVSVGVGAGVGVWAGKCAGLHVGKGRDMKEGGWFLLCHVSVCSCSPLLLIPAFWFAGPCCGSSFLFSYNLPCFAPCHSFLSLQISPQLHNK